MNEARSVLVTGASGLVGRHLVRRLLDKGYQVRGLIRSPAKARELQSMGCQAAEGDIRDHNAIAEAISGVNLVIHLAAILRPWGDSTYESVTVKGTKAILSIARQADVSQFIYVSALGVQPGDSNPYMVAKRHAEDAVKASGLDTIIFRPSYLYGKGSHFLNLLEQLTLLPLIPVVGSGRQRLQLMWVDDLAACIVASLENGSTFNKTYEIGGPSALEFNDVLDEVSRAKARRPRPKIHLPYSLIRPFAAIGAGLIPTLPATPDTLELLLRDNVCDIQYVEDAFGVQLVSFSKGLRRILS